MISIRQNGDVYDVAFPYDVNVIYLVKNVPGRRWVPDRKVWTIPKDRLGFFINQLKGTVYEAATQVFSDEDINVNEMAIYELVCKTCGIEAKFEDVVTSEQIENRTRS